MTTNKWLFFTSLALTLLLAFSLGCLSWIVKRVPINYIVLSIMTLTSSYSISSLIIFVDKDLLIIAGILAISLFIALTVFSLFVSA